MTKDEKLKQLYRAKWNTLGRTVSTYSSLSTPLLAAVPTEYENSKIRLLIIGKETHDWLNRQSLSAAKPVDELRKGYQDFERGKTWRSPFFQAARTLQKLLNTDADTSGFMWLNLFICDQDMQTPREPIAEELRKVSFLREEIRILDPHAVVFFTGPVYDYTIKHKIFSRTLRLSRIQNGGQKFERRDCRERQHEPIIQNTFGSGNSSASSMKSPTG